MYSIYKITNPNNFVYIGQSRDVLTRIKSYKSPCKLQGKIYNSIKKYGYDNHVFEIICSGLSKEMADSEEIRLIKIHKDLGISLNISIGGFNSGKVRSKPIVRFTLNGDFIDKYESIRFAAKQLGIDYRSIGIAIKKKRWYSFDFLWCYEEDYLKGFKPTWVYIDISTIKQKIYKFDLDGNFICSYESIEQAAREEGTNVNNIRPNLIGKCSRAGRFIFSLDNKVEKYFSKRKSSKKLYRYGLDGNLVAEYETPTEAVKILSVNRNTLYNVIRENRTFLNSKFTYKKHD